MMKKSMLLMLVLACSTGGSLGGHGGGLIQQWQQLNEVIPSDEEKQFADALYHLKEAKKQYSIQPVNYDLIIQLIEKAKNVYKDDDRQQLPQHARQVLFEADRFLKNIQLEKKRSELDTKLRDVEKKITYNNQAFNYYAKYKAVGKQLECMVGLKKAYEDKLLIVDQYALGSTEDKLLIVSRYALGSIDRIKILTDDIKRTIQHFENQIKAFKSSQ